VRFRAPAQLVGEPIKNPIEWHITVLLLSQKYFEHVRIWNATFFFEMLFFLKPTNKTANFFEAGFSSSMMRFVKSVLPWYYKFISAVDFLYWF
jgi:hypothetical protein